MKFKVGDPVVIKKLRRAGRVSALPRPGYVDVAVESLTFHCKEEDLEPGKPSKGGSSRLKPNPRGTGKLEKRARLSDSLDLHGLTVEEALKKVEEALNRALLEDRDELRIVHGLGTGKIREAVHEYLRRHGIASHFKLDDANPGVTLVFF